MEEDKQSEVSQESSSKASWLFAVLAVLGLLLAGALFVSTSKQSVQRPAKSVQPERSVIAESASAEVSASVAPVSQSKIIDVKPNIVYNPPREMALGETKRLLIRITNKSISKAVLEKDIENADEINRANIPLTERMTVQLCCGDAKDDPFLIRSYNKEEQVVGIGDFTQWTFDITAQKKGSQSLNLTVSGLYNFEDGESVSYSSPVMTDKIEVKVSAVQELQNWLAEHWSWLGLLLLIPLVGFLVIRALRRRNKTATSGNESIFISYRRDDSSGYTLAIYQRLKDLIGDENVFMDHDDIPHGADFSLHLEKVLGNATTVLVMIGENWLNATNEYGRRLDNPSDYVRIEIATALDRNIRVIPVLLKNAQMPKQSELPEALAPLSKRNGLRIYDDQFEGSIERLIESIT